MFERMARWVCARPAIHQHRNVDYTCTEYWLASLKVVTVVVFVLIGILVNIGVNREHKYIGSSNWHIPGAPFVGGFGGFAHVFVTASFACEFYYCSCDGYDANLIFTFQTAGRRAWVLQPARRETRRKTCQRS
jgi:hypothetical protein